VVTPRMTHTPPEPPPWQPHPWMAEALCRQVGPVIFYAEAPDGLVGKFLAAWNREANREAKSICAICPVRPECLDHAIDTDERHGIWGGMTPDERRAEARQRAARPATTARAACGTRWGYKQHQRAGETACEPCRDANAAASRRLRGAA
jgi:WhiB family transcriptional regulator, redox-sensing transcriptional regulator